VTISIRRMFCVQNGPPPHLSSLHEPHAHLPLVLMLRTRWRGEYGGGVPRASHALVLTDYGRTYSLLENTLRCACHLLPHHGYW